MLKKSIWLLMAIGVLCCSPVWANYDNPWSEYIFATNDQTPTGSQPQVTALKGPITASPQDLCPFTAVCYGQTEPEVCVPGFPGGSVCSYQDPSVTCPVPPATCPAYPFEVKTIYVKLCNPGPGTCDIQVIPAILDSKDSLLPGGGVCHVPGALLCSGPQIIITLPPNAPCQVFAIPLKQPCCVNSDYFACVDIKVLGGPGCNMGVCTDNSCTPCCDYWDGGVAGGPWDDLCLAGGGQLPGNLAIWTDGLHSCQNNCTPPPADTGKNHYKTWRVTPWTIGVKRQVKDQFMTDSLFLQQLEYLSNPVRKIVFGPLVNDTFNITKPNNHLTWYRVTGRDTLLKVEYQNQLEQTTVLIDSVQYLLVPSQKDNLPPFDSLDHYKAYKIRNPQLVNKGIQLEDQFDRSMGTVENVTSFLPVFFLTPCQKWIATGPEPTYDTVTHYVAYEIAPIKNYSGVAHTVTDQFLFQRTIDIFNSRYLLVPTKKLNVHAQEACCDPAGNCSLVDAGTCVPAGGTVVPACLGDGNGNGKDDACEQPVIDTLRNHFKTWRVATPPMNPIDLVVRDQFTIYDFLRVDTIDFLSNPVRKVFVSDTSNILRPNDHLTWYKGKGKAISVRVKFSNQFQFDSLYIDSVKYLLVPTQKDPHPRPDSLLGHYTAYKIRNPKGFRRLVQLQDQFDLTPENIDSLVPRYFLTPADKNNELRPKSDTHYVAYEIFPKGLTNQPTRTTTDQFGPHAMQILRSEYLLVPTRKISFTICTHKPNDCNGDGTINLADIQCDVNVVFHGFPKPVPNCRCDSNGDGNCNLADIVYKVNYVFKGGPKPIPSKECCIAP